MTLFSEKKENIVDVLTKVEMISRKNRSYPIYDCVRIDCNDGYVTFTTTNVEWTFSQYLFTDTPNFEDFRNKEMFVNANQLLKIIRNAERGDKITFSIENPELSKIVNGKLQERLVIETSRSTYFLNLHQMISRENDINKVWQELDLSKEFDGLKSEYVATTSINDYISTMDCVEHATSNEDIREVMKGVACQFSENSFLMVATDSTRIASARVPNCDIERPETEFYISKMIIPHINRCLKTLSNQAMDFYVSVQQNPNANDDNDKEIVKRIWMDFQDGCISFIPHTTMSFPDWRSLAYKKEMSNNFVFDVKSMKDAISDAVVLKHRSYSAVGIKFNCEHGYVKSVINDVGEVISEFDILSSTLDNDYAIFRFDHEVIQDSLNKIDTDKALFRYIDNENGVVVEPVYNEDTTPEQVTCDDNLIYQFVLMPMNQREGNEFEPKELN